MAALFKRLLGVDVMQLEGDWELALDGAQDRIRDLLGLKPARVASKTPQLSRIDVMLAFKNGASGYSLSHFKSALYWLERSKPLRPPFGRVDFGFDDLLGRLRALVARYGDDSRGPIGSAYDTAIGYWLENSEAKLDDAALEAERAARKKAEEQLEGIRFALGPYWADVGIYDAVLNLRRAQERLGALVREYEIESDRIGLDGKTMLDDVETLRAIIRRTIAAAGSLRERQERTEGGLGVSVPREVRRG